MTSRTSAKKSAKSTSRPAITVFCTAGCWSTFPLPYALLILGAVHAVMALRY